MEIYKITSPKEWTYFAKGSANILFKYTGTNDYLRHKLLRLRLIKEDEEYISTCELYDFIELKCKHLFYAPQQIIIDIQLVVLTTDFVAELDSHGNQLQLKERYGLLLPNILDGECTKISLSKLCQLYVNCDDPTTTCSHANSNKAKELSNGNGNNNTLPLPPQPPRIISPSLKINSIIFEIKPKWLYDNTLQNYCRTCSHNQLRHFKRHFCPLDLLYPETLEQGLDDIFSYIPSEVNKLIETNEFPLRQLFLTYLQNPNNVFLKLKQYQKINNKNDLIENLTSQKDVSQNLSLVMTLRDVGLFLKFEKYDPLNDVHNSHNNVNNLITLPPKRRRTKTTTTTTTTTTTQNGSGNTEESLLEEKYLITCNIYDLDLKSTMKYKHWLKVENDLQEIYNSTNPNWRHCNRVGQSMGFPEEKKNKAKRYVIN